ncbi:MAG TPA: hypothetical protein VEX15_12560 [Nocardioidaceae bacterium]|nr:hypothetical protein [Nocardioidaceae bacterium]
MATPPRRLSDRLERAGRRVCVIVAILGVPVAVVFAWTTHNAAAANTDRYAATVHRTEATTLEDAPPAQPAPSSVQPRVEAEWTGADRVVHQGRVEVPRGTEAGTEVMIWTDGDGKVSTAPSSQDQLVFDAVLLAIGVALGATGAAYGAFVLLRLALERLRSREWDLAWEDFARQQRRHQ